MIARLARLTGGPGKDATRDSIKLRIMRNVIIGHVLVGLRNRISQKGGERFERRPYSAVM